MLMPLPCQPDSLPLSDLRWREILPLVGRANASLARYDGMLQTLPNAGILLSPITANEAVLSSKIEGTQATLDEVLEAEAGLIISETRRGDIEEINNYRAAVSIAEAALVHRPSRCHSYERCISNSCREYAVATKCRESSERIKTGSGGAEIR